MLSPNPLTEQGVGMCSELWVEICIRKVERKGGNGEPQSVVVGWKYVGCFILATLCILANYTPQRTAFWNTKFLTHNVLEVRITLKICRDNVAYVLPSMK